MGRDMNGTGTHIWWGYHLDEEKLVAYELPELQPDFNVSAFDPARCMTILTHRIHDPLLICAEALGSHHPWCPECRRFFEECPTCGWHGAGVATDPECVCEGRGFGLRDEPLGALPSLAYPDWPFFGVGAGPCPIELRPRAIW